MRNVVITLASRPQHNIITFLQRHGYVMTEKDGVCIIHCPEGVTSEPLRERGRWNDLLFPSRLSIKEYRDTNGESTLIIL